jgi:5-deoxy-glucuronate isomerase
MKWSYSKGELTSAGWSVLVDDSIPGWKHSGLRVADLKNSSLEIDADHKERLIFAISGSSFDVVYEVSGQKSTTQKMQGRTSVFRGTTDHLYLPMNTKVTIKGNVKVAIAEAPAKNSFPVKFIQASDVPIAIRGAGVSTREVHNFGMPDTLQADRFIVVEVIVPAGNWSGVPCHKHDTYISGKESNLEEIYYFESESHGYFRGYSADEREYDLFTEVHSGDVVLVPYGWHGPVMAAPTGDLYFLNVMAGPDPTREWNATDHPDEVSIRESWKTQKPDPRLPYNAS